MPDQQKTPAPPPPPSPAEILADAIAHPAAAESCSLRIERNGTLVGVPLRVEHLGSDAINSYVTAIAGPEPVAMVAADPAEDAPADSTQE